MDVPDDRFEVNLVHGSDLSAEDLRTFSFVQASDPSLDSPYFSAGFVALVASLSDNVRVGFAYRDAQVVGIFPFQVRGAGAGEPLGHPASDFHGLMTLPGVRLDPLRLLRGCGLRSWDFHHLLAHQEPFRPYHTEIRPSPYLDLSRGFDAYVRERREAGTRQILQIEASRRKLEIAHGELRFVAHASDDSLLQRLREWKEHRFRSRGISREFSPWLWSLLRALCRTETDGFAGMLSALFAGGEPVAVHLGMRSRTRWHYWYPAFDTRFARYQTGLVLLLEMVRNASALGITRIDLSTGDESYKDRVANAYELVARGRIEVGETSGPW